MIWISFAMLFSSTAYADVVDNNTIEVPAPKHHKLRIMDSAYNMDAYPDTTVRAQMLDFSNVTAPAPKAMTRWRGNNISIRR